MQATQHPQKGTTAGGQVDPVVRRPWPPRDEVDGETEALLHAVDQAWCWQWPGWKWVASRVNREYGNNRTAAACRAKYNSLQIDRGTQQ